MNADILDLRDRNNLVLLGKRARLVVQAVTLNDEFRELPAQRSRERPQDQHCGNRRQPGHLMLRSEVLIMNHYCPDDQQNSGDKTKLDKLETRANDGPGHSFLRGHHCKRNGTKSLDPPYSSPEEFS